MLHCGPFTKGHVKRFQFTLIATVIGAFATQGNATIIADSVAEFSGVQGQDNWYYGYWGRTNDADGQYLPTDFQPMNQYLTTPSGDFGPSLHVPCWRVQDGAYWTALWDTGGHPNGTNGNHGHLPIEHWSIRRWVSEVTGQIDVSGLVGCSDGFGCNVAARVYVDRSPVFAITPSPGQGPQPFSFSTVVSAGSAVDFIIDANGSDVNDMTYLTMTITPEPGSLVAMALVFTRVRRRKES